MQEALSSEATGEVIQQIGDKNHLHLDTLGKLVGVIGLVMRGLVHPRDFVNELITELSVSREQANEIAADVNQLIFEPIRDALMELHDTKTSDPLSREALLRDIQNPSTSPISGRKYVVREDLEAAEGAEGEERKEGGGIEPDSGLDSRLRGNDTLGRDDNTTQGASGSLASGSELEARLPNSNPELASILERNTTSVSGLPPVQTTVDPYLEPVE